MTDINFDAAAPGQNDETDSAQNNVDLIELLFFAYRDFISDPDAILARYGFGRAHHRVLHFVNRNPGLTVADLLSILNITKQSLARVLKQLIGSGFIEQMPGPNDRRQRLLYTTPDGRDLAEQLLKPQSRRINNAFRDMQPDDRRIVSKFLFEMIDQAEQPNVSRLTGKEQTD
jgi:DNA-binding MarR family transcriptional regulator